MQDGARQQLECMNLNLPIFSYHSFGSGDSVLCEVSSWTAGRYVSHSCSAARARPNGNKLLVECGCRKSWRDSIRTQHLQEICMFFQYLLTVLTVLNFLFRQEISKVVMTRLSERHRPSQPPLECSVTEHSSTLLVLSGNTTQLLLQTSVSIRT